MDKHLKEYEKALEAERLLIDMELWELIQKLERGQKIYE